jgi:hypothetical protein
MPRTIADSTEAEGGATDAVLYAWADEGAATVSAMLEASNALINGMILLSQEMFAFNDARWRDGYETSQRLMGCRDLSEAFGMQCDLARAARQQYFDETARLMSLAVDAAQSSWAPIEDCTKSALGRLKTEA